MVLSQKLSTKNGIILHICNLSTILSVATALRSYVKGYGEGVVESFEQHMMGASPHLIGFGDDGIVRASGRHLHYYM